MRESLRQQIAHEYLIAAHVPDHSSYSAFVAETLEQYRQLLRKGLTVIPVSGTITGTSDDLFYRADHGEIIIAFDGSPFAPSHPLDRISPFSLAANTVFRIVHDILGHYQTRVPFETYAGEMLAYQNHRRMYSESAQKALYGETVAQLAYHSITGEFVPVQRAAILEIRL